MLQHTISNKTNTKHRNEHKIGERVRSEPSERRRNGKSGGLEGGGVIDRSKGLQMNGSRSGIHLFGANYHRHWMLRESSRHIERERRHSWSSPSPPFLVPRIGSQIHTNVAQTFYLLQTRGGEIGAQIKRRRVHSIATNVIWTWEPLKVVPDNYWQDPKCCPKKTPPATKCNYFSARGMTRQQSNEGIELDPSWDWGHQKHMKRTRCGPWSWQAAMKRREARMSTFGACLSWLGQSRLCDILAAGQLSVLYTC